MKKVLISIQPQWCELIASGKKMIEVRKTRPKIETPFKCYIYCSKGKTFLYKNPNNGELFLDSNGGYRGGDYEDRFLTGKVIGSFVCDKVYKIVPDGEYYSNGYDIDDDMLSETCLGRGYLTGYGLGYTLYGWHITEPKLFDKPKELSEFFVPCKKYNDSELHCMRWDCEHYSFFSGANGDAQEECLCDGYKPLRRPPQSWMYV